MKRRHVVKRRGKVFHTTLPNFITSFFSAITLNTIFPSMCLSVKLVVMQRSVEGRERGRSECVCWFAAHNCVRKTWAIINDCRKKNENILIFYSMSRFVLMYEWFSCDFSFGEIRRKNCKKPFVHVSSKPTSQDCDIYILLDFHATQSSRFFIHFLFSSSWI